MMQEIKNEGWIALYRKLLRSDMWKALTSMQRDLVIVCLLKANHKANEWEWKGEIFNCQPGEFVTSLDNLRAQCAKETSVKMVRTGLKKLEKWGFLAHEGAKTGSKISVINWHTYQNEGKETSKESGTIGAQSGQDKGTIGATNKNVNNEKNDKQCKELIIPGWIDGKTWEDFTQMRKNIKKPLSDLAITRILNKLEDYKNKGMDVKTVLDSSIENSWAGVFELKGNYKKPIEGSGRNYDGIG